MGPFYDCDLSMKKLLSNLYLISVAEIQYSPEKGRSMRERMGFVTEHSKMNTVNCLVINFLTFSDLLNNNKRS
jgi:hypothetical protein